MNHYSLISKEFIHQTKGFEHLLVMDALIKFKEVLHNLQSFKIKAFQASIIPRLRP